MTRFAHSSWAAMSRGGVDLIVDHVFIDATLRGQARGNLPKAFWVEVTCDGGEQMRRENAREPIPRLGFGNVRSRAPRYNLRPRGRHNHDPSIILAHPIHDTVRGRGVDDRVKTKVFRQPRAKGKVVAPARGLGMSPSSSEWPSFSVTVIDLKNDLSAHRGATA